MNRTVDQFVNPENDANAGYISKLERDNADIKNKVQIEQDKQEEMVYKIRDLEKWIEKERKKIDLELENKALKTRLMKQTEDFNALSTE